MNAKDVCRVVKGCKWYPNRDNMYYRFEMAMNSESSSTYFFCICEQVHNKPLPLVEYVLLLTLIQQKNHSLNCLSTCLNQFTCVLSCPPFLVQRTMPQGSPQQPRY